MKPIGIVRYFDKLGRLVVPKEIRTSHGWNEDTPMEIFATEEGLFIKSYKDSSERKEALNYLNKQLVGATNNEEKKAIKTAIDFISKA